MLTITSLAKRATYPPVLKEKQGVKSFGNRGRNKSMVKLHGKIWEGIKVQSYISIGKKVKVWGRILGGNDNMGKNESMTKIYMKIWDEITENYDLSAK